MTTKRGNMQDSRELFKALRIFLQDKGFKIIIERSTKQINSSFYITLYSEQWRETWFIPTEYPDEADPWEKNAFEWYSVAEHGSTRVLTATSIKALIADIIPHNPAYAEVLDRARDGATKSRGI